MRKIKYIQFEINRLMGRRPDWLIVHHSANDHTLQQVNKYHTDLWHFISSLGWGLGYTYWIDQAGIITQCRHDLEEGAHTIGVNKNSIGICLQGNFNDKLPSPSQLKSLKELIDRKKAEYGLANKQIEGHRFFANKDCPGHLLYKLLCQNYPN